MRNREKTKKKIMQAALNVFKTDGFLSGSTETIARKAGVAHGTIFFYFPAKADLIVSCIYEKLGPLAYKLNSTSRGTSDIEEICELFLEEIRPYSNFYSRLVKDLPHLPIDLQRSVFSSLSAFSIHFVDVIEKEQEKNTFRSFDPKIAMFLWFGLVHYLYSYRELLGTDSFTAKDRKNLSSFFKNALSQ